MFKQLFMQLGVGLYTTLIVWVCAALCALVLGIIWGLLCCPRLRVPVLSLVIRVGTMVLRGIPFYIQRLLAYFVLPDILGFHAVNASMIATLTLSICSAAYVSQAVASGINGIAVAQWETAFVLGYCPLQTVRYIIVPQLLRVITPSLIAEADQLMKSTALFSSIGIMELTGVARNIVSRELNPLPVYLAVAGLYVLCSLGINGVMYVARRRGYYAQGN